MSVHGMRTRSNSEVIGMRINRHWLHGTVRSTVLFAALLSLGVTGLSQNAAAQTYSCFPNCNETDGRMLALAGQGLNTLGGDTITMKITSPANANTVTVGIFDGETSGAFDQGSVPLEYKLYADPSGEGKVFTTLIATWSGSDMANNAWTSFTLDNDSRAQAPSGSYIYALRIRNTNPSVTSYSGFKVRTDGAIALKGYQSFAVLAPIDNQYDEAIIYPGGLSDLSNTTYNGTWRFYLDVPFAMNTFAVWDGDMDFGNYNADTIDSDDPDTPNDEPSWANAASIEAEGVAMGSTFTDASGTRMTTGTPPDNNRFSYYSRTPAVRYEVVHPNGTAYTNANPSGNKEWEQFALSTASFNRNTMDYHVDSLPAGIYEIRMYGMDLNNLNAWRFFNDALGTSSYVDVVGVDASGAPVFPAKPYNVTGTIYYDQDGDGVQDAGENGIPAITVRLLSDYNLDGTTDGTRLDTTDANGIYLFANVGPGRHTVQTDMTTLSDDVVATGDPDGTSTANSATLTAAGGTAVSNASFAYKRAVTVGTGTRGYWTNHEENWPVNSLTLGGTTYTKAECLAILRRPTKGDRSYSMAAQLISTKLNLARGTNSSCISTTVSSADAWMASNPIGSKPNNTQWNAGSGYHDTLDDYNNGRMCAPHMD